MSEPVIRMEKIVKTYYVGKPNELEILHGIDLTVNQGEFVSIVGEKTIVLITHSQELATETQRIVTLLDGEIVGDNRGGEH